MTLVLDNEPAFLQGEGLTWLAREAHAALKPDFIFPLDADEFIVPADRGAIESALSALPAGGPAARICLRTFVPTAEDPTDEPNPVRRIRYRSGSQTRVHKVVLTSAFAADPTLVLDHGNHGLLRIGAAARQIPVRAGALSGALRRPSHEQDDRRIPGASRGRSPERRRAAPRHALASLLRGHGRPWSNARYDRAAAYRLVSRQTGPGAHRRARLRSDARTGCTALHAPRP